MFSQTQVVTNKVSHVSVPSAPAARPLYPQQMGLDSDTVILPNRIAADSKEEPCTAVFVELPNPLVPAHQVLEDRLRQRQLDILHTPRRSLARVNARSNASSIVSSAYSPRSSWSSERPMGSWISANSAASRLIRSSNARDVLRRQALVRQGLGRNQRHGSLEARRVPEEA